MRPSPWRQAVDLGNMMLVLAVRTDPARVYRQALNYFTAAELAEAFAATRGVASPTHWSRPPRTRLRPGPCDDPGGPGGSLGGLPALHRRAPVGLDYGRPRDRQRVGQLRAELRPGRAAGGDDHPDRDLPHRGRPADPLRPARHAPVRARRVLQHAGQGHAPQAPSGTCVEGANEGLAGCLLRVPAARDVHGAAGSTRPIRRPLRCPGTRRRGESTCAARCRR